MDAIKKCKQCLAEIPAKAKKCKHCGSKAKVEWQHMSFIEKLGSLGCLTIVIIFLVSLFGGGDYSPSTSSTGGNASRDNSDVAVICARNYVKNMLKSPKTADFPSIMFEPGAVKMNDGKYLFKSYVDAQNGFGAMIRTNYLCTVKVINPSEFQCETECVFE